MFASSIRFRLNFWFAFMQVVISVAASVYLLCLDNSNRMQDLDASLERRLTPLHFAARDSLALENNTPSSWQVPPNVNIDAVTSRRDFLQRALLGRGSELFSKQWVNEGVYFVIWSASKQILAASPNLPESIPLPVAQGENGPINLRTIGGNREAFQFTAAQDIVLVGQSMQAMEAEHQAYVMQIMGFVLCVFVIGLLASRKIIYNAITPLEAIAKSAAQMSLGNIQGRLKAPNPADEVGQLVNTLNSTFSRIDEAFAQQNRFVADAAHELRTPLAVMLSETQAVLNRPRSNQEYVVSLNRILDAIQKLRKLSESLLTLAQLDAEQYRQTPESFDLGLLIDECIGEICRLAETKNVTIHNRVEPITVLGDPDQLCQVFTNLLSNAIEYGTPNSEVHLWVSRSADSAKPALGIHVSNTGETISHEEQKHLFERFYRVDKSRSRAGSHAGLGLAICQRIVNEHNGIISVQSENGLTVFTVWLPEPLATGHSP
ncbi:GHKL domain-containing protein [Aestuariibacter sp. GS-14]|nr:GHKL domain-containing protein [Aestuariibacter sp. GS-14]